MKAIIFLGNPGRKFRESRHNAGWLAGENLFPGVHTKKQFDGRWFCVSRGSHEYRILYPETMMNNSGRSVQAFMSFFKYNIGDILVVHDELELPFGTMAVKRVGGDKGHNGLRSISCSLGSRDYCRLQIGIGRPVRQSVSSYVLSRFDKIEEARMPELLDAIGIKLNESMVVGDVVEGKTLVFK